MSRKIREILLLSALTSTLLFSSAKFEKVTVNKADAISQTISSSNFVSVPNFLYSEKGIQINFNFDVPSSTKTDVFNLMTADWKRLTKSQTMTFNSDGTVTASVGRVFKHGDSYIYQLMLEDLATCLNTDAGEVASGHEELGMMYINDAQVMLDINNVSVIESPINLMNKTYIRDSRKPGLNFKAHIPAKNSSYTYGMIIVPAQFVARYENSYKEQLDAAGKPYIDLKCEPAALTSSDDLYKAYGSGYFIQGTLTNVKEDNYQLPFTAVPYEKDADGNYHYGNFIREAKNTLYETCVNEVETGKINSKSADTKAYINAVLSKCENHFTNTYTENVKAYFAKNTEQVLKTDDLPVDLVTTANLDASKNENETGQIILNTSSSSPLKYYVNFEPFVNSNNSSVKIPARNVTVSKQLYQHVTSNWSSLDSFGSQGYYHGYSETPELGWWPDALVPLDLAIDSGENYISSYNGRNNGLMFRINIPADIPAGLYTSKAVIRILNEGTIVLPINLQVHNFSLGENHSKFMMGINQSQIGYMYGKDSTITGRDGIYYRTAYETIANRGLGANLPADCWDMEDVPHWIETAKKATLDPRIGCYYLPSLSEVISCKLNLKYKKQNIIYTSEENGSVSLDNLLVLSGKDHPYEDNPSVILPGFETLFREMVLASTDECNLFEKASVYFPQADEPGNNASKHLQNILSQNTVIHAAKIVSEMDIFTGKPGVKAALLKVPYVVTSYPRGLMKGKYVSNKTEYNISKYTGFSNLSSNASNCYVTADGSYIETYIMKGYCPNFDSFEQFSGSGQIGYSDIMSMLQDDNYTIWWYGCCMPVPPYPIAWTNSKYIRWRVNKWLQMKLGVEAELYYMCNRSSCIIKDETEGEIEIGINDEDAVLAGACTYNGIFGEGQLIYPVHNKYKAIDPNMYWLSSLKLENLGEANDDYNYLYLAKELISRLPSDQQEIEINKLNAKINAIVGQTGPYYNTSDHDLFGRTRTELANLIDELVTKVN